MGEYAVLWRACGRFWRWALESWWGVPVLVLGWMAVGEGAFWLGSLCSVGKELRVVAFCLLWFGRAAAFLLPMLVAWHLLRERWRLAVQTTLFSAVLLIPMGFYFHWLSWLPCPPDMARQPLGLHVYVFLGVGMAALGCLPLAGLVHLIRGRWRALLATGLFCAAVVPPFAWLVVKMAGFRHLW